jgi:hypothetical protein
MITLGPILTGLRGIQVMGSIMYTLVSGCTRESKAEPRGLRPLKAIYFYTTLSPMDYEIALRIWEMSSLRSSL